MKNLELELQLSEIGKISLLTAYDDKVTLRANAANDELILIIPDRVILTLSESTALRKKKRRDGWVDLISIQR